MKFNRPPSKVVEFHEEIVESNGNLVEFNKYVHP